MKKSLLLIVVALALGAASWYFQYQSNKTAHALAATIETTDNAGNSTTADITSLKNFVADHMGSSVTFTLTGSYNRAQAAATAAAEAASNSSQLYAAAQVACSGKTDSITQAECNEAYLQSHMGAQTTPTTVTEPQLANYQYAFHAPAWTPDLAGSLLVGAVLAMIFAIIGWLWRPGL